MTDAVQAKAPRTAVRLAGNHAAIEWLDLTESVDTTTPSSTSDQPAVKLIIPETQEGAGLEMEARQADKGLLLEGDARYDRHDLEQGLC